MRTDDFDEMKPQDTRDGIPDVVQEEQEDSFNEFGPSSKGGKSLGELMRDNPFIKIALVGVAVVAVVGGLFMFGGSSKKEEQSQVGIVYKEGEAPGKQTSEQYRNAVNDVNQQKVEDAMRTGQSAIPIPTSGPSVSGVDSMNEEPPVAIEDPLANWRATAEAPVQDGPVQADPAVNNNNYANMQPQQGPAAVAGPDPAAVDALSQAMSQQMQSILGKHTIAGPQIIQVTALEKETTTTTTTTTGTDTATNGAVTAETETVEILVPAGTIAYAQLLTEANSDAPGPVLARISSGPLQGTRILGTFEQSEEFLTLNFNTVVIKGVSYPVNAIALDPKTTLPAVASEVDHRYWRRFILPAAARFIEGMGDAVANREETNISVSGDTVTSSKPDLNTREELAAGLSDGTKEIADDLDQMGDDTKVLVRVHAGTPIGILFIEPVTEQN